MPRYELLYSSEFDRDLEALGAYNGPIVRAALILLSEQAELESRNRRHLAKPLSWCPEATWQVRVGNYRVLYRVDAGKVKILRVRFKGIRTSEEMGE